MYVHLIMSTDVITIAEDATLEEAINLCTGRRISGMPVLSREDKVTGVISEKDILAFTIQEKIVPFTRLAALTGQNPDLKEMDLLRNSMDKLAQTPVRHVMTSDVITITEETLIAEAARIMNRHKVNRIPVVDKENKLKGIVTRADLISYLAEKEENLR